VPGNHNDIEKRLWDAADEMRANSKLKSSEYSLPVLGLIFLKHADHVFSRAAKELEGKSTGRRTVGKIDYQDKGVPFLPEKARFSYLIGLPESTDIGKAIDDAMRAIEEENEELKGVLKKGLLGYKYPGKIIVSCGRTTSPRRRCLRRSSWWQQSSHPQVAE
jgi:type I restriction enzyme M protein